MEGVYVFIRSKDTSFDKGTLDVGWTWVFNLNFEMEIRLKIL